MSNGNDEWLTVSEAASMAGYHADHVRRLIRAGEISAKKFSIVWQVNRESLLAYLQKAEALGERRGPKKSDHSSS